ncbi:MAG TPA: T9SS type A sorting domain-containing protein [Ignavibacteriaceae bacterium]|nr:T9SS type A sorting domain-containing protein [Ignavibacteriaceae bacterium]
MKKNILFFFLLLVFYSSVDVLGQFTTVWERKTPTINPTWFTTGNNARGIGYGVVSSNHRLYVAYDGNKIKILNASDGSDVGDLDMTGVTVGARILNSVKVAGNNKIFGCNLTTNATTNAFKIYMWDGESGASTNVITYNTTAIRLGDNFNVIGSYTDGTCVVYATPGTTTRTVLRWTQTGAGGTFNSTPDEFVLPNTAADWGTPSYVVPLEAGSNSKFWAGGRSQTYIREYTSANANTGYVTETGIAAASYFSYGGNIFLGLYIPASFNVKVRQIGAPGTTWTDRTGTVYGTTPALGSTNAGGLGDVALKDNGDGTFTVFVLATNNGIGAYTTSNPLPVELTALSYKLQNGFIDLSWTTATEVNSYKFEVEKSADKSAWAKIGEVSASGNSNSNKEYSFTDNQPASGKYFYRLKIVDNDGSFAYSKEIEVEIEIPKTFALMQNYPNPFNPTTTISYQIPAESNVKLLLFSVTGEQVRELVNSNQSAGRYNVTLDASGLASGTYIYRLVAGDFVSTKKLVVLK